MLLFLFLDPLLLLLLMHLIAKDETKASSYRILIYCLMLSFLVLCAFPLIGLFYVFIYAFFLPIALVQFCGIPLKKSLLGVGLFLALSLAGRFLFLFAFAAIFSN